MTDDTRAGLREIVIQNLTFLIGAKPSDVQPDSLITQTADDIIAACDRYSSERANEARIDERRRFDDEIDDVLTRHQTNKDLSPIAELRDYNYNAIEALTAKAKGDV